MSSNLKRAQYEHSMAVAKYEQQVTGDDLCNLEKAKLFKDVIYWNKEMLEFAVGELEVPENTFDGLLGHVNDMDEDGELDQIIKDLEEATDEPEDPNEHSPMCHSLQGTTPFTRR